MTLFRISLTKFEKPSFKNNTKRALREFHINKDVRESCGLEGSLFSLSGNVVIADIRQARNLAMQLNSKPEIVNNPERSVKAGQLNAMGLIDEILHFMVGLYKEQIQNDVFETALERIGQNLGQKETERLLNTFGTQFPPKMVYSGNSTVEQYLASSEHGESCRALSLEEILLLALANLNPAFKPFNFLFNDSGLSEKSIYPGAVEELKAHLASLPVFGPDGMNLWDLLRAPALASPDSLLGQLEYMRKNWGLLIGKFIGRLLTSLDIIKEEEKPYFGGPGPSYAPDYSWLEHEYEAFSPDQEWMPRTVLMAKSTLVWLYQLSQKYGQEITRLDQIPDAELDELGRRGFTGLWLIGLWERSQASKTVKQWTGNPEAAASAYSLYDYDIAAELGGWEALAQLRDRCYRRGIRLGSDMVPNHTGLDSRWMIEHPDRFLQLPYPPFPTYNYSCNNLSGRDDITVQIEDHYFDRSDAAVVFKRIDNHSGHTRYIYHGNDGTSMPWNDTAQIDFLNPEAREAVIATIVGVCQQFPIVRFDAAMTLAKRHIQRLWYPAPGHGGDIASRAEHSISTEEFNRRIPNEFWREVVDRCASDAPHTLLLAEAFWMMEGYFVRTLGMHRVYNSAFMNMLKNEDNAKYRSTIKNTLEFDPEVLKRFVNFMNNPDEDTAVAQFGKGDKYFGIATLLVTMPGLPMFGHGQIEGYEEKYGMEYRRSYYDEKPDSYLVDRHEHDIFPLMKKRYIFSGSANFVFYDLFNPEGHVDENVFAYSNRAGHPSLGPGNPGNEEQALVIYNNSYYQSAGWIKRGAVAIPQKDGTYRQDDLSTALGLNNNDRFFTLFREQRSGLWFIRSSKALTEGGLFVSLNGYEAQVYLDIHEVCDKEGALHGSWDARWARLNHDLNGRGAHDLNEAALNIFLGELYYPLEEVFKVKIPKTGIESPSFIKAFKKPVLDFVKTAEKYIYGFEGGYTPFKTLKKSETMPIINPDEIWKSFSDFLERLKDCYELPDKKLADKCGLAPILAYGILSLLRQILGNSSGEEAAQLAEHWLLFRKFANIWAGLGMDHGEAYRIAEISRAVLTRTFPELSVKPEPAKPGIEKPGAAKSGSAKPDIKKPSSSKDADKIITAFILENYELPDFNMVFGINHFDGVTWFNKELFEQAIFWIKRFILPESCKVFGKGADTKEDLLERTKLIDSVFKQLKKAEKASGYKLDEFMEALVKK